MTSNLLLDKNIALDIILGRKNWYRVSDILKTYNSLFITTHTFATCFYILRKEGLSKEKIYQNLAQFELLEINKTDCHFAYNLAKNIDDIEDCLELFTAKRNGAKIMTADQAMILKYGEFFDVVEI